MWIYFTIILFKFKKENLSEKLETIAFYHELYVKHLIVWIKNDNSC